MNSLLKPGSVTKAKPCCLSYHPLLEKLSDGGGRKNSQKQTVQSKASVTVQQLKGHADAMCYPWVTVTCRMLTQTSHLQEALHCAASYKVRDGAS